MKKLFFTQVLSFVLFTAFGQNFTVSGLAKSETNEGVAFATVAIFKLKDSTLVKADVTDGNGGFKLSNVPKGQFYLTISSVGFEKFSSKMIEILDKNLELPSFIVKNETKTLGEVVVTSRKPMIEVLADKTVFNVQASLSATGTTGFELLRKSPGIIIDNADNLILEGKTGVAIYIDGRPSILRGEDLTNFLKTLQAADIEAIEIITQPSARFDAAGNAGIVNIRLKKDKRFGTNGSVALGGSYGIFGRLNSSVSVNNRSKKVNFFANYSNNLGKTQSFMDLYRQQASTVFDLKTETVNDAKSHNVKAGADVFINNKSTFGVILNGNFNAGIMKTDSRTPISLLTATSPNQVLVAQNSSDYDNKNLYLNTNYRFADTLGHVLNVDADYGVYNSKRLNDQPNFYYNGSETQKISERIYQMNTPKTIGILTFKADYEQSFLKGKLGIGAKFSQVKTDNTFDFYDFLNNNKIKNLDRSNQFNYTENINAAYVSYNQNFGKVSFQGGLRVEHTASEGKLTSSQQNKDSLVLRDYVNFFPSGGLTYNPNQNNAWALTYSRRVERPNYQSLNPFETKTDELTSYRGNPYLQPQYTDNLKLSHTYKYTLTTSLSYSYVKDFFAQITDTVESTRNFMMEQNIANQRVINLGISYPFEVAKWWNVYVNVNAYQSSFEAKNEKFTAITQTTASFYGQNTFSLPQKWTLEVSGWFSSPSVWGGTYLTKSLGSLDLAIQKKVFNETVSVRLAVSDVLFTSPWGGNMTYGDLKISGRGGWESRQIKLNLSYNFGNKQVKSARKRDPGLEDEKGRIN